MAVAMIALLMVIDLIIVAMVIGGGRDHELTVHRTQTIEAFYAAEAGMNMSIRELMEDADEDTDGTIGTISDDGTPANDPGFGAARFFVTVSADWPAVGLKTLTSEGRSGNSRREASGVLE